MCFGFFEKLPVSLMRTLQLMDRSIIEYRTDPKAIVMLTYTLENQEEGTSVEHTEMRIMYTKVFLRKVLPCFTVKKWSA